MTPIGTSRSSPDLTVGLPVYNGQRYLASALDSVLNQSYSDFLLIISDNASTDGTEDICRDYEARDERIAYSRQERNMGGSWNFNTVVENTSSPLFKWITHDDITGDGFLERCMLEITSAPDNVILCYPRTTLVDADDGEIEPFDDQLDLRQRTPHERLRGYLDNYRMSNALFGILRTDMLKRTSMNRGYASSDKVLMAELAMLGEFWEVPERLFLRRVHEGMSRRANITPEEVAQWFDPNHPRPVTMNRTKLYVEYMRSIASPRLGLGAAERMRCMRELIASGGLHELHVIGGEMKREAKIGVTRTRRRLLG